MFSKVFTFAKKTENAKRNKKDMEKSGKSKTCGAFNKKNLKKAAPGAIFDAMKAFFPDFGALWGSQNAPRIGSKKEVKK